MEEVFKALGDATRLQIVRMLAENGETCVCHIMDKLGMGQSAVSHHMAVLKHAGFLRARREGQWIHYSLDLKAMDEGPLAFLRNVVESGSVLARAAESERCEQEKWTP